MLKKVLGKIAMLLIAFIVFASAVLLFLFFIGRNSQHKIHEDGYFRYIVVDRNTRFAPQKKPCIAIVGLTESGLQQESLDFPTTIAGKQVKFLGYRRADTFSTGCYYLKSDNLKKVYIHDIHTIYEEFFIGGNFDIMVCASRNHPRGETNSGLHDIFIYKTIFDSLDESCSEWLEEQEQYAFSKAMTLPANITFMNNYSNEVNDGFYRLDNIESGEKIQQPPDPKRDGYKFTGWFTESACENRWDFNNTKEVSEGDEFRLYAGWEQK